MIGIDLRDLPAVGAVVGVVASIGDVIFYSGETLVGFAFFVFETIDLWLPYLSRLQVAASELPIPIPVEWIETATLALTMMFLGSMTVRIYQRYKERNQ